MLETNVFTNGSRRREKTCCNDCSSWRCEIKEMEERLRHHVSYAGGRVVMQAKSGNQALDVRHKSKFRGSCSRRGCHRQAPQHPDRQDEEEGQQIVIHDRMMGWTHEPAKRGEGGGGLTEGEDSRQLD